jgi:hypothetical protein
MYFRLANPIRLSRLGLHMTKVRIVISAGRPLMKDRQPNFFAGGTHLNKSDYKNISNKYFVWQVVLATSKANASSQIGRLA